MKIYFGIFIPAAALFIIFASDAVYWQYGFTAFLLISYLVGIYFAYKVRCTRCGHFLILALFGNAYFWEIGLCYACGVRLKKQRISEKAWKIIQVAVIAIVIPLMIAALYCMFKPC